MFLGKITLLNFKNHERFERTFTRKLNCFIGKNGAGKTNLLDAIYYLCLTKSYFNSNDQQNVLFGKDFFRLDGEFNKTDKKHTITYKLQSNKRKELIINDISITKLSDHIGNFPAIIISPDDSQLVLGGSEERRKFMDSTISQLNHQYLEWLIFYNKILAQRNAALKRTEPNQKPDRHLIESYDKQLTKAGTLIYQSRKAVMEEKLMPLFQSFYKEISLEREAVSFTYNSQLSEKPFDILLHDNFEKDSMLQRTEVGIHKDELEFYLTPTPKSPKGDLNTKMKKFGSQGQQKSFIIAIKMAQYELIRQNKEFQPLLLIDDIFDKLDNDRSQQLIELIASPRFGQVFLTDTDDAHIRQTLKGREELFEVFDL